MTNPIQRAKEIFSKKEDKDNTGEKNTQNTRDETVTTQPIDTAEDRVKTQVDDINKSGGPLRVPEEDLANQPVLSAEELNRKTAELNK